MTELKDIEQEKWTIFWKHRKKNAWGQFFDWLNEKVVFKDFSQIMAENSSQGLVLEAGSGCAESTLFLGKERGDTIFALDLSLEALRGARKFSEKHAVPVRTVCADLRNIPFQDKAFDLVFSGGVIEHFEHPVDIVSAKRRIAPARDGRRFC